jgi:hypothetical protein
MSGLKTKPAGNFISLSEECVGVFFKSEVLYNSKIMFKHNKFLI